ncbi:vesicle transport protein USE1 [Episyrphus balteatus]|uniref:vesicle transport protein USE1 n=1 Tax=Episyrphus balteatus TaxID=286459 RepID=UPI002485C43B|nr:vesicle transport protein USE1 [Episyrphus balteatus]
MVTKLEINLRSLLSTCEELVKDETNFWRLKKFIKSMDVMIEELQEYEDARTLSSISDYCKRLQSLKTQTNYIDSPPLLAETSSHNRMANENVDDVIREVRQLQNSKHYSDIRKELINDDNLRSRKPQEQGQSNEALKYHNDVQEKITEHMLSLTRSLKEQTEIANRIIKRDTEVVSKSTNMTDKNINSLTKENEKLQEHSKNAWKCWTFLMFGSVIFIFIGMVLFMKIVKKT